MARIRFGRDSRGFGGRRSVHRHCLWLVNLHCHPIILGGYHRIVSPLRCHPHLVILDHDDLIGVARGVALGEGRCRVSLFGWRFLQTQSGPLVDHFPPVKHHPRCCGAFGDKPIFSSLAVVNERCAPWPPLSTVTDGTSNGYFVLTMWTDPMSAVLVNIPLSMLGCTARVATITVQSIDFSTGSTNPVKRIAESCWGWRLGRSFEGRWPCCRRAVRPCWWRFGGPRRWRLGGVWSLGWRRGRRSRLWWSLVLRTVRPCIPPAPIIPPLAIAGRTLQGMCRNFRLAVVAPPCVEKTFSRRGPPGFWPAISTGGRGRWRLLRLCPRGVR